MSSLESDDWEKFLESNYHQLSRRIRVENLVTRLRAMSVLSQDDQESVLHQYKTTFLKAGHLLDIVRMKGRPGFDKFMEAIEYEYPELYLEITGREPRPDPQHTGSMRRPGATSTMVLSKMGDLIGDFARQLTLKQSELKEFQDRVLQLRAELEKQAEEQKNLEDRFRDLEDTVQELRDEKKEMSENLSKERRLREEFEGKYDRLRSRNLDEMYNLSIKYKPVRQCSSLAGNSTTASSTASSTMSSLSSSLSAPVSRGSVRPSSGKVKELTNSFEQGIVKPDVVEAVPEAVPEAAKKTGSETTDAGTLQESCCQLQESNDRLQCCIEEFKKEADECRSKQTEAESHSRETCAENEKLKAENRKMEEQCRLMADMIRSLKSEIDNRFTKQNKLFIPRMFPEGDEAESVTESPGPLRQSKPKPKPIRDQKRQGSEPTPVASKLLEQSFLFLSDPWKSVDK